jgi:hypothetical protein
VLTRSPQDLERAIGHGILPIDTQLMLHRMRRSLRYETSNVSRS